MTKYYLHIGLHKTGTKLLQHKFFKYLDSKEIFYNPEKLVQLICDLIKAEDEDVERVLHLIREEKVRLEKNNTHKKILISREIMSGNLLNFYQDSFEYHKRLKLAFSDANILLCLRFQYDWIISCYKESVKLHHYQSLEDFLNFKKKDQFIKVDYLKLDFVKYIKNLYNLFSIEKVNIIFYENLKLNKNDYLDSILEFLGVGKFNVIKSDNEIPNRGYSSFSIKSMVFIFQIFKKIGIESVFHRPITLFGKKSIPAGFESLSCLPKEKYWGDEFLRDNEEVRSSRYPNNLTIKEKLKIYISLKFIVNKIFEKFIYLELDLIEKKKSNEIKNYFFKKNLELLKIFGDKLPINYYKTFD